MREHAALIAKVLRNLGHPVPSENELKSALSDAFLEMKKADGVDPDNVKYKLSLVPVTKDWVKETF